MQDSDAVSTPPFEIGYTTEEGIVKTFNLTIRLQKISQPGVFKQRSIDVLKFEITHADAALIKAVEAEAKKIHSSLNEWIVAMPDSGTEKRGIFSMHGQENKFGTQMINAVVDAVEQCSSEGKVGKEETRKALAQTVDGLKQRPGAAATR